jgi:hypothetical protein
MHDLLIRHGRILDSTGSALYTADVGVKDSDGDGEQLPTTGLGRIRYLSL